MSPGIRERARTNEDVNAAPGTAKEGAEAVAREPSETKEQQATHPEQFNRPKRGY
jgi:hypothetical protein